MQDAQGKENDEPETNGHNETNENIKTNGQTETKKTFKTNDLHSYAKVCFYLGKASSLSLKYGGRQFLVTFSAAYPNWYPSIR